jgi:hypothetical protein
MPPSPDSDTLAALRAENERLIGLLDAHGIQWRPAAAASAAPEITPSRLSTDEKVALFGQLFRGRTDVYPVRWEAKTSGKTGYSPACANEWRQGVCDKPRIKCGDCGSRELIPLSDAVLFKHLAGDHTIGSYPLLTDDTCNFLAVDFDEAEWRADALAFVQAGRSLGVPVALEISRSGNTQRLYACGSGGSRAIERWDTVSPSMLAMPGRRSWCWKKGDPTAEVWCAGLGSAHSAHSSVAHTASDWMTSTNRSA